MPYTFYFEKLEVWHLAIELAKDIYQSTASFPREEKFGLTNQIRRASVSVSSNLAEGSARITKKDQAHFSTIAFK